MRSSALTLPYYNPLILPMSKPRPKHNQWPPQWHTTHPWQDQEQLRGSQRPGMNTLHFSSWFHTRRASYTITVSALRPGGGTGRWGAGQQSAGDSTQHRTPPRQVLWNWWNSRRPHLQIQTVHQKSKFNLMSRGFFIYQFKQTREYVFFFIFY